MKRVLITGAKGFTGRYVAAEMASYGWDVWSTGVHDDPDDSRYRRADLTGVSGLQNVIDEVQPDAVVHLAAIAFVGHGDPSAFYAVNLIGTRNLLAALAASEKPPGCVLLASSANVYGNSLEGVLSETAPPNPVNDYAVSKLAMEYAARLWMNKLPLVIARPFNYTGVGQSEAFLLPKIVKHFRSRSPVIELGNLDVSRDFSDVRAVARAYRRLVETCPKGATVNVCSGQAHSLREVLRLAEKITGHTVRPEVNPAFVRDNEVRKLCGDSSLLRSYIGEWETVPLEDTLRWMLDKV